MPDSDDMTPGVAVDPRAGTVWSGLGEGDERPVQLPAIVAAGDGRASKAVYGDNKAYLEIDACSLQQN